MFSLKDKVALITGAGRGMGAAEARMFVKNGAKVLLCDILDDDGAKVAAELGSAAAYQHLDVRNEADWKHAVEMAIYKFGKLNVLVNNAGIVPPMKALDQVTLVDFQRVIDVNQVGVFLGMRAVVAAMRAAKGGSIINISSIDGLVGNWGAIAYVSTKFAVRGMTKVAALELGADKIRVNSIHPGGIMTPILETAGLTEEQANEIFKKVPLQRIGQPDEIAGLALYLASDASSYSTGSEFIADGGLTAGFSLEG